MAGFIVHLEEMVSEVKSLKKEFDDVKKVQSNLNEKFQRLKARVPKKVCTQAEKFKEAAIVLPTSIPELPELPFPDDAEQLSPTDFCVNNLQLNDTAFDLLLSTDDRTRQRGENVVVVFKRDDNEVSNLRKNVDDVHLELFGIQMQLESQKEELQMLELTYPYKAFSDRVVSDLNPNLQIAAIPSPVEFFLAPFFND